MNKYILPTVCLAILSLWLAYPILVHYFNPTYRLTETALFGDSYGGLNALFSGLAFLGLIVSIRLQSKELADTRKELSNQTEQFTLQVKATNKQMFENTFFQMLHLHNEIVDAVFIDDSGFMYMQTLEMETQTISGRRAFNKLYSRYIVTSERPQSFAEHYDEFYDIYGDVLGHYFRNIYHILNFINNSDIENPKFYANLLRAQMSSFELILLLVNCCSKYGTEKHKPLLEKYEFFEHVQPLQIPFPECYKLYSNEAYGTNMNPYDYFETNGELKLGEWVLKS